MDLDQRRQVVSAGSGPYRIAFESNDEVGVGCRIGESAFPQAFGIDGRFPDAMIAFVDGSAKGDASTLERAHMFAQVHEQRGIHGKRFEPLAELAVKGYRALHV